MKKIFTLFIVSTLMGNTIAQMDINTFNACGGGYSVTRLTDYQCLGVNPANLGWTWNENAYNLGLMETGLSIHTEALSRKQVMNDLFDESIHLTMKEREEAASDFTDAIFWAQGGITWLGFSFQDDKIGGFAFSVRDRGLWNTKLNKEAARFLFLGYHDPYFDSLAVQFVDTTGYAKNPLPAAQVYSGTSLQFIWYREFNVGYGRKFIDTKDLKFYGGAGLKYLIGYGSFHYLQGESGLNAYSALSPLFEVDYGEPTPSQVDGKGMKKVGSGIGIDLGATLVLKEKLTVSLSLNDIGSINWDGNVYEGQNVKVWKIETPGVDNYNIFSQGELIVTDDAPDEPGLWKGLENKQVGLPMHLRLGGSYKIIPSVEVGADLYMPMTKDVPGAYDGPVMGLGTYYEPARWVQLSLGFVSGKDLGTNIPFGVSFFPARDEDTSWQVGFAVRDVSSLLKQDNPMVSAAFGFLRFSFGSKRI